MLYTSTRGKAPVVDFATATLQGLAPDGGLYMPGKFPHISESEWRNLAGLSYAMLAERLLTPFIGNSIAPEKFRQLIATAYADFPASGAPLVQLDHQIWMLELYHGPTLAFKDYALQLLGHIFSTLLQQNQQKLILLGATSGDTGAAALAAVANKPNVAIVMLHPHERVSPIQRRQMTTLEADNISNVAINGTFDDCQDIVKALFADNNLRRKLPLSSVNSINWARVMAQLVYYAKAALSLGAPDRVLDFCVPSGNFGNVFAGYIAKQMGLPIRTLRVASNSNDILHRMINHNDTSQKPVVPTLSPSMDIQISSNFERLLYLLNDSDGAQTEADMLAMRAGQYHRFSDTVYDTLRRNFAAGMADDQTIIAEIRRVQEATGQTIDPHTAVATRVAHEAHVNRPNPHENVPCVVLATAHSAKFPAAMEQALGRATELPKAHHDILERKEKFLTMEAETPAVREYLLKEYADYARP